MALHSRDVATVKQAWAPVGSGEPSSQSAEDSPGECPEYYRRNRKKMLASSIEIALLLSKS
jgi:hypothetical protein